MIVGCATAGVSDRHLNLFLTFQYRVESRFIRRTHKGNGNWFEKSEPREFRDKIGLFIVRQSEAKKSKENDFWFELSRVRKIGIPLLIAK